MRRSCDVNVTSESQVKLQGSLQAAVVQGRSVRIDLPPVRPNGLTGPCPRALIGGAQPYMVGGSPSHSAIKEGGGRGSRYEVHRAASHPTDIQTLDPIESRGAASDGKYHRRRQRHPTLTPPPRTPQRHSLSTDRRCRRADGVRQRNPGRSFNNYGIRWFATYPLSLCET